MILSSVGQNAGIGFAIPINTAKAVLNDLVTLGRVRRPTFGVRTIPIGPELAQEIGLPADYGLLIVQVVQGGAADRAGLRGGSERAYLGNMPIMLGGDLIVAIDGEDIQDQQDLSQIMNNHRAGDTVQGDHLSWQEEDGRQRRAGRGAPAGVILNGRRGHSLGRRITSILSQAARGVRCITTQAEIRDQLLHVQG